MEDAYVEMILKWSVNRINRLSDLVQNQLSFIWVVPSATIPLDDQQLKIIMKFMSVLETLDTLEKEALKKLLKQFSKENGEKYANFMKTLRGLLSGLKVSLYTQIRTN